MKFQSYASWRMCIYLLTIVLLVGINTLGRLEIRLTYFDHHSTGALAAATESYYITGFPFKIAESPALGFHSVESESFGNCICFWGNLTHFYVQNAMANLLLAGGLLYFFHYISLWKRFGTYSLASVFSAFVLFALTMSWYARHARLHVRENRALEKIDRDYFREYKLTAHVSPSRSAIKCVGGFTPVRILFPSPAWKIFDHVLAVEIDADSSDIVSNLEYLTALQVRGEISDDGVYEIGKAKHLQFLDMRFVRRLNESDYEPESTDPLRLPVLPKLRQLDISHSDVIFSNVESLSRLQRISVCSTLLSHQAIMDLISLPAIRVIEVGQDISFPRIPDTTTVIYCSESPL